MKNYVQKLKKKCEFEKLEIIISGHFLPNEEFIVNSSFPSEIKSTIRAWFIYITYSGAHISWHELFLAGNKGNHQGIHANL